MTYLHNDYELIEAQDNAMNYLLLKERAGDWKILVFDWDLSEDEVSTLIEKFKSDSLTDKDVMNENKNFVDGDKLDTYVTFKILA